MIHVIWITTAAMLAACLELAAGRFGLLIPFFLAVVFYFMIIYPASRILLLIAVFAVILDLAFARSGIVTLGIAALTVYGARLWNKHGDCHRQILQCVPGAILGFVWCGGLIIVEKLMQEPLHWRTVGACVFLIVEAAVLGAVALPAVVIVMDTIAERLNLAEYRLVQRRGERR